MSLDANVHAVGIFMDIMKAFGTIDYNISLKNKLLWN